MNYYEVPFRMPPQKGSGLKKNLKYIAPAGIFTAGILYSLGGESSPTPPSQNDTLESILNEILQEETQKTINTEASNALVDYRDIQSGINPNWVYG